MAAVERRRVELATGSEGAHKERGLALVEIKAGDPVIVTDDPVDTRYDFAVTKATDEAYVDGIALDHAPANLTVEFLRRGEAEGFANLTPGTSLTVVAGAIDDTAPAAGVTPYLRAVTPTRIVKLF